MPKVAPIIVAALPIPNTMSATTLYGLLDKVLNGLLDHKIKVISYACDGTEVERSVQRILVSKADSEGNVVRKAIKDPHGGPELVIEIVIFRGQHIAIIQDSKHCLKTMRNNLFSGARCLVMGNYTALYDHIRQVAVEDKSPIYRRDVFKLDRQDDNAAQRLFSADTLEYLLDNHPNYRGDAVYLFAFGELVDAYQNRWISHSDRLTMVLRARYFLDAWEAFLAISKYPRARYFISREAADILRIIIEGFISLLYIHRDYLGTPAPLLPWLHSSEACEHVFAEARKIVKDFSMLDFFYMVPKLRIKIRHALLSSRISNSKARANGYNHTYIDSTGIDIVKLGTFPTDEEIEEISEIAGAEAKELISFLGIRAEQLISIRNLALPAQAAAMPDHESDEEELDIDNESDSDEESICEQEELQKLIEESARTAHIDRRNAVEQRILTLTSAATALTTNDLTAV